MTALRADIGSTMPRSPRSFYVIRFRSSRRVSTPVTEHPYRLVIHVYLFGRYQVILARCGAGHEGQRKPQ
jgi:hypothetical protein